MGKTVDYVSGHRRGVTEAVVIAVAVGVLVGGFFLYRAWTERAAGKSLSAAIGILETPLASDAAAAGAPKTFASAAERRVEAEKFLQQAAAHGSTRSGRAAQVILAANGADKPGQSVDVFERPPAPRRPSAAAAEIDAKLLASQGKATEAIDRLKRDRVADLGGSKDALLFTLAAIYEQADLPRTRARLPAPDHRLPELALPRGRAAEGPAVVTLLHATLGAPSASG
jgi:hypothetical protein